jgi:hypothetical protein
LLSPCGPSDVQGASLGYADDRLAKTQNLTVQALTGYTIARGGRSDGNFNDAITPSAFSAAPSPSR